MDILEFRESYINEDINAEAVNTSRYHVEVFIDNAADILKNDYSLITDMSQCFYSFSKGTRAYKNMHIDAAYLDLASNKLDLLFADYNEGEITSITNEVVNRESQLLLNFFENSLKGFFVSAEQADPAVQQQRAAEQRRKHQQHRVARPLHAPLQRAGQHDGHEQHRQQRHHDHRKAYFPKIAADDRPDCRAHDQRICVADEDHRARRQEFCARQLP